MEPITFTDRVYLVGTRSDRHTPIKRTLINFFEYCLDFSSQRFEILEDRLGDRIVKLDPHALQATWIETALKIALIVFTLSLGLLMCAAVVAWDRHCHHYCYRISPSKQSISSVTTEEESHLKRTAEQARATTVPSFVSERVRQLFSKDPFTTKELSLLAQKTISQSDDSFDSCFESRIARQAVFSLGSPISPNSETEEQREFHRFLMRRAMLVTQEDTERLLEQRRLKLAKENEAVDQMQEGTLVLPNEDQAIANQSIQANKDNLSEIEFIQKESLTLACECLNKNFKVAILNGAAPDDLGDFAVRSALRFSIDPDKNPHLQGQFKAGKFEIAQPSDVIFSPMVPVFRSSREEGYAMKEAVYVDFITCRPPEKGDLFSESYFRQVNDELSEDMDLSEEMSIEELSAYGITNREIIRKSLRAVYHAAIANGNDVLILNAFGHDEQPFPPLLRKIMEEVHRELGSPIKKVYCCTYGTH